MSQLTDTDLPESWSRIPLHVLHAELKRRQDEGEKPECGTKGGRGTYNTGLHVFALFLILFLSTLACSFPILARRFPKFPVPHYFLFLSRHFGTGVLIATAFVHLLPTAFTSLNDPCLPSFWNKGYPPMPGLIAMTSVFIVVGIEMFFATRGAGHMHGSEYDTLPVDQPVQLSNGHASQNSKAHIRRFSQGPLGDENNSDTLHLTAHAGGPGGYGHVPTHSPGLNSASDDEADILSPRSSISDDDGPAMLPPTSPSAQKSPRRPHSSRPSASFLRRSTHEIPTDPLAAQAMEKKLLLQCLLLEAGILFHSVFIGIAVSVSVGPPFIVLLIAISFHQTFEGLALGSRIAAIPTLAPTSPKPWLMALAYGATTPLGQAIGLGVHGLYDPQGQAGLLMVGTMNAVSSGLLLFAGLVELLAEDFLSDHSYASLRGRRRREACGAVVAGAFLMALVGAWA